MKDEALNIYQRMNLVRSKVGYVQKDKEVQGYKVVTHDAVTREIRSSLIEVGIIVIPSLVEDAVIQDTSMTTKNGVPIIRYEAKYQVSFINMDTPEDRFEMTVSGHALDQGDKAPGKAISYAVKTALLKAFSMETGEDEEGRIQAESGKYNKLIGCTLAARQHFNEIAEIKTLLNKDDQIEAANVWFDIPKDDKELLWLAPTKGGLFTTEERKQMLDNDFTATMRQLHVDNGTPLIDPTEGSDSPHKDIENHLIEKE